MNEQGGHEHETDWAAAGPEAMRNRLRDHVYALHRAYLTHLQHFPPAVRGAMPLASQQGLTVIVAAARELHLIATPETLPPPRGQEVEEIDEVEGVSWRVRFYDASILPELGVLGGTHDDAGAVRRILGVADVVYHISVSLGGGLTAHHAQHAGVALANQHASSVRDGESLRRAYPAHEAAVDEFVVAERLGMAQAARLLAGVIGGSELSPTASPQEARQHLLALAKGRTADSEGT